MRTMVWHSPYHSYRSSHNAQEPDEATDYQIINEAQLAIYTPSMRHNWQNNKTKVELKNLMLLTQFDLSKGGEGGK